MLPLNHYLLIYFTFKGHLQPVCMTFVHFTEIICCNTEITKVISVFDNRIVSLFLLRRVSQPAIALGCKDTIRFSNTIRTFVISILEHSTLVKCTTAMHTGWRCPFKSTRNVSFQSFFMVTTTTNVGPEFPLWKLIPLRSVFSILAHRGLKKRYHEDDIIVQTLSVVIPFWYLAPASDICLDSASWESHSPFNKLSASQKNFKALSQK